MDRNSRRLYFAIAVTVTALLGVISYFMAFIKIPSVDIFGFDVDMPSMSYIKAASEGGNVLAYIPFVLSICCLICSVFFLIGKEKLVYAAAGTDLVSLIIVPIVMRTSVKNATSGSLGFLSDIIDISVKDLFGGGYTLFKIAHILTLLICAAYIALELFEGGKVEVSR